MNPRITALTDDQALEPAAEILRGTKRAIGMTPNLHRTLAHAPAALEAYAAMTGAMAKGALDPKLREKIAVASAGVNGCTYCASAHTAIGKALKIDAAELESNLVSESNDERAAAALALVRSAILNRGQVTDQEFAAVRDAGFNDQEIVEIITHVGINMFTNLFNIVAQTEVDFPVVQLPQPA